MFQNIEKVKIEGCTTCSLNTYSFDILILSSWRLYNAVRAVTSTGFSKQTSLNSSTSVTQFLPKNKKVLVKLGIGHQGCFCTLFQSITRALCDIT